MNQNQDQHIKRLKLYKALKIGYYRNERKQAKALKKYGYVLDKELSMGRERMVAFNPTTKKVLFVENGTNPTNVGDIVNDAYLVAGAIKKTGRFKRAKNTLNLAHDRYKDYKFTLAGHSLGGNLTNYIATPSDKVINYNAAYSKNAKPRANVTNFRVASDPISSYSPEGNTKIVEVPKQQKEPTAQTNKLLRPKPKETEEASTKVIEGNAIKEQATAATTFNPIAGHYLSNIQGASIFL